MPAIHGFEGSDTINVVAISIELLTRCAHRRRQRERSAT